LKQTPFVLMISKGFLIHTQSLRLGLFLNQYRVVGNYRDGLLIPYAKTVTFQSSYFIRACKTWNILSDILRDRNIGFYASKSGLKLYYKNALLNTYNCDDPRTWKSVCAKCKRAIDPLMVF
jgi:hypothetical protein